MPLLIEALSAAVTDYAEAAVISKEYPQDEARVVTQLVERLGRISRMPGLSFDFDGLATLGILGRAPLKNPETGKTRIHAYRAKVLPKDCGCFVQLDWRTMATSPTTRGTLRHWRTRIEEKLEAGLCSNVEG